MNDESVFDQARRISSTEARTAFLEQACANDEQRRRVEQLLRANHQADSLLDAPLIDVATEPLPTSLEQPGAAIGPYKLLQQIGEGGFGLVYLAEQQEPVRRRVALKVIKPGMDSRQVIARFEAERQALAMMDHPNIATVLDAGMTDAGRPYFVMELVKGLPITQFCDDQRLSLRERLELFVPVCHAIQHAHQKGLIHRDIKPSNLLVSLYDGRPVPKVIDFGVAKAIQHRLTDKTVFTQFGQVVGTIEYMSPEQAEFNQLDIDTRSDIYSLGAVLYELLAGTTPFDRHRLKSAAFDEMLRIIREEEPLRPSLRLSSVENLPVISEQRKLEPAKLTRLVHGELDWIVMKALEKDRGRRYETAGGLSDDIQRFLNADPVVAAAPSAGYRIQSYVRKHKTALAVATTIALLLIAGIVSTSLLAYQQYQGRIRQQADAERLEQRGWELQAAVEASKKAQEKAEEERQKAERLAYRSHMTLAETSWQNGAISRLKKVLDETATSSQRGLEWFEWQARLREDERTIWPGLGPLWSVQVISNGRELMFEVDRSRFIVSAATGEVRAVFPDYPRSQDGRWILTRTDLIDTSTRVRTPIEVPDVHEIPGQSRLSPDATWLAQYNYSTSTLQVTNIRSGESHILGEGPLFRSPFFSPDGRFLAVHSASEENKLRVWSTTDWSIVAETDMESDGRLRGFTADSSLLIVQPTYLRGEIQLLEVSTLALHKQLQTTDSLVEVAFSPDMEYFAFADATKRIVIKEAKTERVVAAYRGHTGRVTGLSFLPDNGQLVSSSRDGSLKFWSVGRKDFLEIGDPTKRARAPFLSTDGSRLLVGSHLSAHLVDLDSRQTLASMDEVIIAFLSADGKRIVGHRQEDESHFIFVADDTGRELKRFAVDERVRGMVASHDGDRISYVTPSKCVLLDTGTGQTLLTEMVGDTPSVGAGFCTTDTMYLAFTNRIVFYSAETGKRTQSLSWNPDVLMDWSELSPDGSQMVIVTGKRDNPSKGLLVLDVKTGKTITRIEAVFEGTRFAVFTPDGSRIVSDTTEGRLQLWDPTTGFELGAIQPEHGRPFRDFAIAGNGRRFAMAGPGGVWIRELPSLAQVKAWAEQEANGRQPSQLDWWQTTGTIQDWLVLVPRPLASKARAAQDEVPALEVARLRPQAGDAVPLATGQLVWRAHHCPTWLVDFVEVMGQARDAFSAYAVSYLHSDQPRDDVRLLLGMDDQAQVYLNGKLVYDTGDEKGRALRAGDVEVQVNLRRGENVLLARVTNLKDGCKFCAQLLDAEYRPLPDVTTSAERTGD